MAAFKCGYSRVFNVAKNCSLGGLFSALWPHLLSAA